jgi:hypothetical protein
MKNKAGAGTGNSDAQERQREIRRLEETLGARYLGPIEHREYFECDMYGPGLYENGNQTPICTGVCYVSVDEQHLRPIVCCDTCEWTMGAVTPDVPADKLQDALIAIVNSLVEILRDARAGKLAKRGPPNEDKETKADHDQGADKLARHLGSQKTRSSALQKR